MSARLFAFVIWALIGASAAFWGLRLTVRAPASPAHAIAAGDALAGRGDLSRLLGAPPVVAIETSAAVAPEASSRFRLLGIVAARPGSTGPQGGVALIAVDGKPPRAFTVGAHVDPDLVLQSVSLRTASIGPAQGDKAVVLEIPRLPTAATGALPPVGIPVPPALAPVAAPSPLVPPLGAVPQPLIAPPVPAAGGQVQRDGTALTQ